MPRSISQQIEMIPIARIKVLNPRARNKRVHREIVNNIEAVGLKQPITVSRRSGTGPIRYDLVCGEGRLEAFRMLGETEIPALVIEASEAVRQGRGQPSLWRMAGKIEPLRPTVGDKSIVVVLERCLICFRFDLNPGSLPGQGLLGDQIDIGHGLPQNAHPAPSARIKQKIDQGFEIDPIKVLDHPRCNCCKRILCLLGLSECGVGFAAQAAPEIVCLFNPTDCALIIGRFGQG